MISKDIRINYLIFLKLVFLMWLEWFHRDQTDTLAYLNNDLNFPKWSKIFSRHAVKRTRDGPSQWRGHSLSNLHLGFQLTLDWDNWPLATPITFHRTEFYCGSLHQFESPHPTLPSPSVCLSSVCLMSALLVMMSSSEWPQSLHLLLPPTCRGLSSPLLPCPPLAPLEGSVGCPKFRVNHNCDVITLLHNVQAVTSPPSSPCDRYLNRAGGLLCFLWNFIHFHSINIFQSRVNIFSHREWLDMNLDNNQSISTKRPVWPVTHFLSVMFGLEYFLKTK